MNPYDLFPFPSAPLPRTHPHALGGLAMLHGFAAPAGVRVLDIGCGAGRNLAWIAATSDCECPGVDLASTAIADAREFAHGLLALERVEFRVQLTLDVGTTRKRSHTITEIVPALLQFQPHGRCP